jgi:pimeloyl-ACP methyl ester carboxylesterase
MLHPAASFSRNDSSEASLITAEEWFAGGRRVPFDPQQKRIVSSSNANTVNVFQRVVYPVNASTAPSRWMTFLPGFPDGSYGFAKVDQLLEDTPNSMVRLIPRLYVEYVGQGDSDKPVNYAYSTMERADLVEAQWRANGVRKTVVVTFDFSSLVLMELLRRQMERSFSSTYIEHVLILNGGLFADGHSHPWNTTPLLQTRVGRFGSRMAQHSNWMLNTMLRPLHSKSYRSKQAQRRELREIRKTIRRHKGTSVLPVAAGFVREHQKYSDRWNLYNILTNLQSQNQSITFEIVGSNEDPFEHRQINLARQRLQPFYPQVRTERIPGGHLSTAERTQDIVARIEALALKISIASVSSILPSWSNVATSPRSQPSWTAIY